MSNGRKIAYVLIAVGICGMIGLAVIYSGIIPGSPGEETVPDITGMRLDKAVIMLYSTDAGKYDRTVRFVKYEESTPLEECEPLKVETDRMNDFEVMAVSPEPGTRYRPEKDSLYIAVRDRLEAV